MLRYATVLLHGQLVLLLLHAGRFLLLAMFIPPHLGYPALLHSCLTEAKYSLAAFWVSSHRIRARSSGVVTLYHCQAAVTIVIFTNISTMRPTVLPMFIIVYIVGRVFRVWHLECISAIAKSIVVKSATASSKIQYHMAVSTTATLSTTLSTTESNLLQLLMLL